MARGWRQGLTTAAVLLAAAVSGCSCDSLTPERTTEPLQTTTQTPPVEPGATDDRGAPVPEGSGCEPGPGDLPDGRWFGIVTTLADDEIELDLACWFVGESAVLAAQEDGEESPPPNDYYIRDAGADAARARVAPDASVLYHPNGSPQGVSGTVDDLIRSGEERGGYPYGVWIDVVDGEAVSVQEQWVP